MGSSSNSERITSRGGRLTCYHRPRSQKQRIRRVGALAAGWRTMPSSVVLLLVLSVDVVIMGVYRMSYRRLLSQPAAIHRRSVRGTVFFSGRRRARRGRRGRRLVSASLLVLLPLPQELVTCANRAELPTTKKDAVVRQLQLYQTKKSEGT